MSASSLTDDIIWACIRQCVTGASDSVDAIVSAKSLERAENHNLLPILAAALVDQPPDQQQILTNASRKRRIRALVMTQEMLRVVKACGKAGIRVVPLKGVALANTIYPSPTLRYFDDLDLLVAPEQAKAALAIIEQLGYQPHERGSADWHHDTPYTHPKHGTTIDLHTDVVRRYGDDDWSLSDIWTRLERHTIHGQPVELLSTTDALIHTALHARHHLFEKPTFLLDTALLLSKHLSAGEGWQALIKEMTAAGALVPFAHLVAILVERQLIDPIPPFPVSRWRMAIARRVHSWQDFAPRAQKLRYGTLPKVIELFLMDSLQASAAMLRSLATPDAAFVGEKYGSHWTRILARMRLFTRQLFNQ